jgi:hypothetical protein
MWEKYFFPPLKFKYLRFKSQTTQRGGNFVWANKKRALRGHADFLKKSPNSQQRESAAFTDAATDELLQHIWLSDGNK